MSGHSRWWIEHPDQIHPVDEIMIQHIQGYILALEDILRDIENARYCDDAHHEYREGRSDALDLIEHSVEESRASAMWTLETMTKKMDAAE